MHVTMNTSVEEGQSESLSVCVFASCTAIAEGDREAEAAAGEVAPGVGKEEKEGVHSQERAGEEKGAKVCRWHGMDDAPTKLSTAFAGPPPQAEHQVFQEKYSTLQEAKEGLTIQLKQAWKQVQVTNDEVSTVDSGC